MPEANEVQGIDRREAIRRVTALLGGVALAGGGTLCSAVERAHARAATVRQVGTFTAQDIALLDEVADTILPETKTPGAKAAHTGAFMALMVTDTYDERQQGIFRDGMQRLNDAAFMADTRAQGAPPHYFRQMKELALLGYFTSEIGCTQAMRYRETPGRFDPCVPYT